MSTRSQKRGNNQQESTENESETFVSPILVQNKEPNEQDVVISGPPNTKSPRIENAARKGLRASLEEEVTSES